MARKANFDRQEKLLIAMELFWKKGYANTSVSELVEALNINRFSLYNTYGDKQQLYYEALETYLNHVSFPLAKPLAKEDADLDTLADFLKKFAKRQREKTCGCFVQNALVEHAGEDHQVLRKGHFIFDYMLEIFTHALENAKRQSQISPDTNVHQLARLLLNHIQGMRVLGKAKRYDDLDDAVACLLGLLNGYRVEKH
ncbi:HTH-type transcriptional repressor ComR [Vibrio aerogenes CECT 7868]|uniref:HTH-type transcriptional repressor ComR n=1 Tax=Vibrio aerogenes CECT 7868 TaxID=1216006 RepID=A0A1M5Z4U1_9VIBR|nr:TetR/AcrR family transcriptional regulator [Vibrio aerogenes]SHI19229.1 HTH-type transcriptional repressor ComR [Vibrio aerogenes CECT 7868]